MDRWLFGIPVTSWAIAGAVAVAVYLALEITLQVVANRLGKVAERSTNRIDDVVVEVLRATRRWMLVVVALLVGLQFVDLPVRWQERVSHLWFVVAAIQLALWISRIAMVALRRHLSTHSNVAQASATATLMTIAIQTLLWTTVLLAVLANLGVNITAMVTSLGVGGIAVALAVQNILGDLFASLAIALDKPFEVGDAISVGSVSGTVEKVGLKTTRLRAPSGEQIVMANADLLKGAVQNFKRQTDRRIVFRFTVASTTPADVAGQIPDAVRDIVQAQPRIRFDRAHLAKLGDTGLEYEVVYIVETSNYGVYMDTQQRIYLDLLRRLEALKVESALPRTQLVAPPTGDRGIVLQESAADSRP